MNKNNNFIYKNNTQLNPVHFLSKEETFNFLIQDSDNYIHNFNQSDLISRNVFSINEYLNRISNSAESFTNNEKKYLINLSEMANNKIRNSQIENFSSSKLANIPFIFAKTSKNNYENGFPHTRENIIFLATPFFNFSKDQAIKTLIHEKIHLFQRLYPNDTHHFLEQNGYQYQGELSPSQMRIKRSNPDINNSIWIDQNGEMMLPLFKNKNPKSMNDLATSEKKQHPYEDMAYNFEKLIK